MLVVCSSFINIHGNMYFFDFRMKSYLLIGITLSHVEQILRLVLSYGFN